MKTLLGLAVAAMTMISVNAAAQPHANLRLGEDKGRQETCQHWSHKDGPGMMKELNLTDSQRKEIDKLHKKQEKNRQAHMKAREKQYEKSRKTAEKAFADYDKQMRKILSPEQYSAWKKGAERRRHEMGEHRHGDNKHHMSGPETGKRPGARPDRNDHRGHKHHGGK